MASRALPDLIARIRLDSTGVDEAVGNLTGTFGKANLAMAGVAAGLGLIVVGAKSMIDIAIQQDAATSHLNQAWQGSVQGLKEYKDQIDAFILKNQPYIQSQSAVTEGFARLTRSGLDTAEAQRVMGMALDLSAVKHISLDEAVTVLSNAEHGRLRGLIDLGVTTSKFTDVNGNLIVSQHSVRDSMDEVEKKLAGGRDTTSDLDQKTNDLRGHWETLSDKTGPGLVGALDAIVGKANDWYNALDKIGKDDALWKRINDRLVTAAGWFADFSNKVAQPADAFAWWDPASYDLGPGGIPIPKHRATGGPVLPHSVYTVGEKGPETLVMGAMGGTVIPNSGGSGSSTGTTVNVTVMGSVMQERDLALSIRETIRRLDREQR